MCENKEDHLQRTYIEKRRGFRNTGSPSSSQKSTTGRDKTHREVVAREIGGKKESIMEYKRKKVKRNTKHDEE